MDQQQIYDLMLIRSNAIGLTADYKGFTNGNDSLTCPMCSKKERDDLPHTLFYCSNPIINTEQSKMRQKIWEELVRDGGSLRHDWKLLDNTTKMLALLAANSNCEPKLQAKNSQHMLNYITKILTLRGIE